MARIILFGARGRLGHLLIPEALDRGHEVTAVTRDGSGIEPADRLSIVVGEISDPAGVASLAAGHDAAISAIGPREGDPHEKLSKDFQTLLAGLAEAGVPGSSSSAAPARRRWRRVELLIDQPDFPRLRQAHGVEGGHRPREAAHDGDAGRLGLHEPGGLLRPRRAADRDLPHGTDNLIADDEGSYLSYADGAIVVLDEVEQANHHFARFTAGR